MKAAVVYEMQRKYTLKILLKISRLKRSTYYYALSKTNKDMNNDEIMNFIINIFAPTSNHGYSKITLELKKGSLC